MIELSLAVNDDNGNVNEYFEALEVQLNGDVVMHFDVRQDVALAFCENLDAETIQVGYTILDYDERGTMVGNVCWNRYSVYSKHVVRMLNCFKEDYEGDLILTEAESSLFAKWNSDALFTADDFNALIANAN